MTGAHERAHRIWLSNCKQDVHGVRPGISKSYFLLKLSPIVHALSGYVVLGVLPSVTVFDSIPAAV